jgi:RNA polymerase sigma-70 factor (ECF subfamily)
MAEQHPQDRYPDKQEDVFGRIVHDYQEKIINTCYRFVHQQQDAEDVAQEVFIEVYRSLDAFQGKAALSTWIYRIAVTKSLDYLRKKGRKKRFGHLRRFLGFEDDRGEQTFEPQDPSTSVDRLEQQERAAILQQAVAALPENQRVAITLNKYEALSYAEVARVMDTTVSSVESLIHRAKKNLHKRLARYYDEKLSKNPQDGASDDV